MPRASMFASALVLGVVTTYALGQLANSSAGGTQEVATVAAEGEGCDRDLPASREWLRRAVAGGYEYAEGLLAHLDSLQQNLDRRDSDE